jgi:hypothetical protein
METQCSAFVKAFAICGVAYVASLGCHVAAGQPSASTSGREIVVSAEQWGRGVSARVGDVIRVAPPASYDEWNVHASSDVIRALDSAERQRRPGSEGWRFESVRTGTAELSFVPFVGDGAPSQPRFTLSVVVQ